MYILGLTVTVNLARLFKKIFDFVVTKAKVARRFLQMKYGWFKPSPKEIKVVPIKPQIDDPLIYGRPSPLDVMGPTSNLSMEKDVSAMVIMFDKTIGVN